MNKFALEILSPEGTAFKGEAFTASFPTSSGIITVLPGHANLVTKLKEGEILFNFDGGNKKITITGGFLEISEHKVNVVAGFAVPSEEANQYKIDQAMKLAAEMKSRAKNKADMSVIEAQLKKSVFDLKLNAKIKRKKQ